MEHRSVQQCCLTFYSLIGIDLTMEKLTFSPSSNKIIDQFMGQHHRNPQCGFGVVIIRADVLDGNVHEVHCLSLAMGQRHASGQCGPKDKLMAKVFCEKDSAKSGRGIKTGGKARTFCRSRASPTASWCRQMAAYHCDPVAIGSSRADIKSLSQFPGNLPLVPILDIFFVISEQWPWLSLDNPKVASQMQVHVFKKINQL